MTVLPPAHRSSNSLPLIEGYRHGFGEHVVDLRDEPIRPMGSSVRVRQRRIGLGLAATDVACAASALFGATIAVADIRSIPTLAPALALVGLLAWVAVFAASGLYSPRRLSISEEFRRTAGAASVGVLLFSIVSTASSASVPPSWFVVAWVVALGLELACRGLWRAHIDSLTLDGSLALRTLIIGTDDEAENIAHLLDTPGSGFKPLGYVNVSNPSPSANTLPTLGMAEELSSLIADHDAESLFIASSALSPDSVSSALRLGRRAGLHVFVSANLPQVLPDRVSVQHVGGSTVLSVSARRLTPTQATLKRAFDVCFASVGLLLAAPLWVAIAVAIRVTSPGPALLRQRRVTKDGRPFLMYKFRTMVEEADLLLVERGLDKSELFFKLRQDPRVTVVGRVLRRFSLDELPQLLNVLRGEMSLVGPRPLIVEQVDRNQDLLAWRHDVHAGMTGWWQVHGRNDLTAAEAVQYDLFYIENWSLSLDVYILFKTAGAVLSRKGAY